MSDAKPIPSDWAEKTIGDLFLLDSGTSPIGLRAGDQSGPVLVYGANGSIGSIDADNYGPGYLVGRVGAAGAVTRVDCRVWASDNALTATPQRDRCDWRFGEHVLRFVNPTKLATMTAQPLITQGNLGRLSVLVPLKIGEQSRIAAVLDTVDAAIQQTESVITKLKQVRAGLLHDLLTRGLDEHGQLRPAPAEAPHLYQDSPLGKIPREWVLQPLGIRLQDNSGFVQTGPFGSQLHAHEYRREGVPVIMPQDIAEGRFDPSDIARIAPSKADELKRHRVQLGDLIFARRGDLSRCAAVTDREVGWLCGTGCLLMRFAQRTLMSSWLSLAYRHDAGQRQIAARAVGTTMVNLNTTLLAHLVFAFPPRQEQEGSASQVSEVDYAADIETGYLSKLKKVKSALMADLLTGRVRVPENFGLTAAHL